MSRFRITEQQVKLYMQFRKTNTQLTAAAKAGISERSARRIEKGQLQPKKSQKRSYRTRKDPLDKVWDSLVIPWISQDPSISPVGIYDHLCTHHSDKFSPSSRRTLERRIAQWRHLHGQEKEVIFLQSHTYGQLGIADFTHLKTPVTINNEPLKHLLFHYRLPASGWAYAQVIYGGETFNALSDGLQNAFKASQGVPLKVRTDSLSAAYKNQHLKQDFTQRYAELAKHYSFIPTRNNRGIAHENGAIEGAHGHLKSQITQALKIRSSNNFNSKQDYEIFIQDIVNRRNLRIADKLQQEQRQLQPLPAHPSVNYTEIYATIRRTSTFSLYRVTYTVPSRLIGAKVLIRAYDAKLELYLGTNKLLELERLYTPAGQSARSVNYHHIIDALNKKPLAFRHSRLKDDILPNAHYKQIWSYLDQELPADEACYYLVRLLYLAHKNNCERQLANFVLAGISERQLPSIRSCEDRFSNLRVSTPKITIAQHSLADYSQLLGGSHYAQ